MKHEFKFKSDICSIKKTSKALQTGRLKPPLNALRKMPAACKQKTTRQKRPRWVPVEFRLPTFKRL
jgi:hypothetical protein